MFEIKYLRRKTVIFGAPLPGACLPPLAVDDSSGPPAAKPRQS